MSMCLCDCFDVCACVCVNVCVCVRDCAGEGAQEVLDHGATRAAWAPTAVRRNGMGVGSVRETFYVSVPVSAREMSSNSHIPHPCNGTYVGIYKNLR